MQLVKRNNGTIRSYREEVILPNGTRLTKTFKRKSDAKIWKQRLLSNSMQEEALGVKTVQEFTFKDFAHNWLENKVKLQRATSTCYKYNNVLTSILYPFFGDLLLTEITLTHAEQLIKKLKQKGHNAKGINNIIGVAKSVLSDAVKKDLIIKSPFNGYEKLKSNPITDIYWSDEEINQFLQANFNRPFYSLYVLALNSGMRRGELAGLCWDKVDFKNCRIEIGRTRDQFGLKETTKTGKKRYIPMVGVVQQVLHELWEKRLNNQFVFYKQDGTPFDVHHFDREFKKDQLFAGLERHIHFHALRHTFASHFMMRGGNLYDLQLILGHSRPEMTQRYSHLSPEHLAKAIQIVSFCGKQGLAPNN